jgi:hypothetical protein
MLKGRGFKVNECYRSPGSASANRFVRGCEGAVRGPSFSSNFWLNQKSSRRHFGFNKQKLLRLVAFYEAGALLRGCYRPQPWLKSSR